MLLSSDGLIGAALHASIQRDREEIRHSNHQELFRTTKSCMALLGGPHEHAGHRGSLNYIEF